MLRSISLHCIALHCIALRLLHYIALYCVCFILIMLYGIVVWLFALHCIALHCIALHCIALHCIALHCIAFLSFTLYCIIALRRNALHYIGPTRAEWQHSQALHPCFCGLACRDWKQTRHPVVVSASVP